MLLESIQQLKGTASSVGTGLCQLYAKRYSSIAEARLLEAVRAVQPLSITATCVMVICATFKVGLHCIFCRHCMTPCHMQQ